MVKVKNSVACLDVDESMPGYTAVGKNVMVLKEHEVRIIFLKYLIFFLS